MYLFISIPPTADELAGHFVAFLFGFIFGAIPFGYIISKKQGIDIRSYGSGNIGFTNVYRVLGFKTALPVFILDFAKGFLPTLFANRLGLMAIFTGAGALLGHIFTPFLKFRGGKGVATTFGIALALTPISFGLSIVFFAIILLIFSYVSLASITFAVTLPILTMILSNNRIIFFFTLFNGLLLIITHRSNIRRLLKKEEPKFRLRKNQSSRALWTGDSDFSENNTS